MRRVWTRAELLSGGVTDDALTWSVRTGARHRVAHGLYLEGDAPTDLERRLAIVVATGGVASGRLAARLHQLDGFDDAVPPESDLSLPRATRRRRGRRRVLTADQHVVVDGVATTSLVQTLVDLAAEVTDDAWEWALEDVLRRGTPLADVEVAARRMSLERQPGAPRARRVLARRPDGARPTESLLETLAVQMIRLDPRLAEPTRQVVVRDDDGVFIARVDLAWPELGWFLELDGEGHTGQPAYDAVRQTDVAAATGWLVARVSWTEVTRVPRTTLRRLVRLDARARRVHGVAAA